MQIFRKKGLSQKLLGIFLCFIGIAILIILLPFWFWLAVLSLGLLGLGCLILKS